MNTLNLSFNEQQYTTLLFQTLDSIFQNNEETIYTTYSSILLDGWEQLSSNSELKSGTINKAMFANLHHQMIFAERDKSELRQQALNIWWDRLATPYAKENWWQSIFQNQCTLLDMAVMIKQWNWIEKQLQPLNSVERLRAWTSKTKQHYSSENIMILCSIGDGHVSSVQEVLREFGWNNVFKNISTQEVFGYAEHPEMVKTLLNHLPKALTYQDLQFLEKKWGGNAQISVKTRKNMNQLVQATIPIEQIQPMTHAQFLQLRREDQSWGKTNELWKTHRHHPNTHEAGMTILGWLAIEMIHGKKRQQKNNPTFWKSLEPIWQQRTLLDKWWLGMAANALKTNMTFRQKEKTVWEVMFQEGECPWLEQADQEFQTIWGNPNLIQQDFTGWKNTNSTQSLFETAERALVKHFQFIQTEYQSLTPWNATNRNDRSAWTTLLEMWDMLTPQEQQTWAKILMQRPKTETLMTHALLCIQGKHETHRLSFDEWVEQVQETSQLLSTNRQLFYKLNEWRNVWGHSGFTQIVKTIPWDLHGPGQGILAEHLLLLAWNKEEKWPKPLQSKAWKETIARWMKQWLELSTEQQFERLNSNGYHPLNEEQHARLGRLNTCMQKFVLQRQFHEGVSKAETVGSTRPRMRM